MIGFNLPMSADGGSEIGSAQAFLTEVNGGFVARLPQAILRILVPGQAGDAGSSDGQFIPLGTEATGDIKGLHPAPFLTAMGNLILDFAVV